MRDPTHFGGVWKPRSGVSGCAARDGAAGSADRGRACYGTSPPRGASNFGWSLRTNYCRGCFDILPALKKGRGFLRSLVWFQPEHFRRVPVSSIGLTAPHLRRLHIGACPALAGVYCEYSPEPLHIRSEERRVGKECRLR